MNLERPLISAHRLKLPSSTASASSFGLGVRDFVSRQLGADQARVDVVPAAPPSLEERAFNALAAAKMWTSHVAMHMEMSTRDRVFRQLDRLHECDEWIEDERPVLLNSYQGFIRFMLMQDGDSKPSLGLAPDGRLVAVWQVGENRLTIEFVDRDHAKWVVSRKNGDEIERAAGSTILSRLVANLQPYNPGEWLGFE